MRTNTRFEIGTKRFSASPLDAFEQLHCARRIGPVIGMVMKAAASQPATIAARGNGEGGAPDDGEFRNFTASLMEPALAALAAMPDAEVNYLVTTCLKHVGIEGEKGTGFAPVMQGGHLMFDDIDLPMMLRIVVEVLQANLASFFNTAASDSLGLKAAPAAQVS